MSVATSRALPRALPDAPPGAPRGATPRATALAPAPPARLSPAPSVPSLARSARKPPAAAAKGPSDADLVAACRRGSQAAWADLIARYKNLIYSIPLRAGLDADDAGEVFQWVCLRLLNELPRLRDPQALPAWLMRVTARRSAQRRRERGAWVEWAEETAERGAEREAAFETELHLEAMRGELRRALEEMPPRCRRLLTMLFFEAPPRPYAEIAASLGLARGSVSLTRTRCLARLRKRLESAGFAAPSWP